MVIVRGAPTTVFRNPSVHRAGRCGHRPYAINQRSPPVNGGGMWSCRRAEETAPVFHCEKQRQFCAKFLRFAQKRLSCRNENPRHNILCLGFFQRFRSETCVLFCLRSQENAGKTTVEPLPRQGNFSLQSSAVLGILKNTVGNCGEIIHIGGAKSHTRPQNDHGVVKT